MNLKGDIETTGAFVRIGRKITQEIEDAYKSHYGILGWTDTSDGDYVSFVDPSGRWHHLFNRLDDRYIVLDGHWKVNLVNTKEG